MPEPVTISLLALNGLGWLAGTMAGSLAGGATDRAYRSALKGMRDRFAGLRGVPENHDIARGVRMAQLQALERVIRDFRTRGRPEWITTPHTRPELFFQRSLAFAADAIGRSRDLSIKHNLDVTEELTGSVDRILERPGHEGPANQRAAEVGASAEDAVLLELRDALGGVVFPDGFEDHFRQGAPPSPRFLDLFAAFIGEQIKTNDRFRAIFTTGQLSRLEGLAMDTTELLQGIDQRFGGALQRIETTIDSQAAVLAEILARVSADKGVPAAPLQSVLARLGESNVPAEEIAARLAAKAEEYLALREQWSKAADANPDVARVVEQAMAWLEAGDLDGARALVSDARARRQRARQTAAREEATLLANEAQLDLLALRYRDGAERLAEAAALVPFDTELARACETRRLRALLAQGEEFGDNAALAEAIEGARAMAAAVPRREQPAAWAGWMVGLGYGLTALGHRERSNARLEEAAAVYRSALEELPRDTMPFDWAAAQNNLSSVLVHLAERDGDTDLLEEAALALRAALEERTRERVPGDWADSMHNLGNVLAMLGELRNDSAMIDEAARAFEAALEERAREKNPFRWAATMNSLAAVQSVLGTRHDDPARLDAAIEAYRAVLTVNTRERVPLEWANSLNNLGVALRQLGGARKNTEMLEQAAAVHRESLGELTRERVPMQWAMAQGNIGIALALLATHTEGTAHLEEAIAACRAALEVLTAEFRPHHWTQIQFMLGHSLALLGEREGPPELFAEAAKAFRASLQARAPDKEPFQWALTQFNLATTLRLLGEQTGDLSALGEAIRAYRAALEVATPEQHASLHQRATSGLTAALERLSAPPLASPGES